jgi:predicted phage terminase large subunit-like protein
MTGRGAHVLVIDDPFKNWEEAQSRGRRELVWNWWTTVARTRLAPGGSVIIIMTRWNRDDLVGRIQKAPGWERWEDLRLQCFAGEDDPMGRSKGDMLWPGRFSIEELAELRATLSPAQFEALYQQNPSIEGGHIFKREWMRYYNPEAQPHFDRIIQSWDTAFKKGQENDFCACTTWGETRTHYYLLDRWMEKVEYPELKRVAISLNDRFNPHGVVVEDAASGQPLIQEMKKENNMPIVGFKVGGNVTDRKTVMAHSVTPLVESGRVLLPERAPWLHDYVENLVGFPQMEHDDDVDSTTQGLAYMRQGKTTTGLLEYYRQEMERRQTNN